MKQLWSKHHGAAPDWLQELTDAAAAGAAQPTELPPILVAAFSTHAYAHILHQVLQLAPEMQRLLRLQAADGSTLLHHALAAAVAHDRHTDFSALSQQLQILLYTGVPLAAVDANGHTTSKKARLAIQRLRADYPAQAQQDAQYLARVEAVLAVLERLQPAGDGLRFFIKEDQHTHQRLPVVCPCTAFRTVPVCIEFSL